jgi:hypothetical protein
MGIAQTFSTQVFLRQPFVIPWINDTGEENQSVTNRFIASYQRSG